MSDILMSECFISTSNNSDCRWARFQEGSKTVPMSILLVTHKPNQIKSRLWVSGSISDFCSCVTASLSKKLRVTVSLVCECVSVCECKWVNVARCKRLYGPSRSKGPKCKSIYHLEYYELLEIYSE